MKKLRITIADKVYEVAVELLADVAAVSNPAPATPAPVAAVAAPVSPGGGAGSVASPLAGKVVSIEVKRGDRVEEGQTLIVLEAMKMNTYVTAETAGTVTDIFIVAGDAVEEGQALIAVN